MPRSSPLHTAPARAVDAPSKTRRKQHASDLQDLGLALGELSDARLAPLHLPERLLDALVQFRNTRTHEGRRRQLQYVGKGGMEEGVEQIGNSIIVAPSGQIVAACTTMGDELAIARCDLDLCKSYKTTTFNFARHREPEQYRMIVERKGAIEPD